MPSGSCPQEPWGREELLLDSHSTHKATHTHTRTYAHVCTLRSHCTHPPHTHTYSRPPVPLAPRLTPIASHSRTRMCDAGRGCVFNPSRHPGEISAPITSPPARALGGQPGLGGSLGLGKVAAGSWILTWALHSFPCGPALGRRVRATGPPPLSGCVARGKLPGSCHQEKGREDSQHLRLHHPDICYILQGLAFPLQPQNPAGCSRAALLSAHCPLPSWPGSSASSLPHTLSLLCPGSGGAGGQDGWG